MTFSETATDLDARLTVLENYQSSLEAKGCPRASCGVSMDVLSFISPTEGGSIICNNGVTVKGFTGTDTPVALRVEISTVQNFSSIYAYKEMNVSDRNDKQIGGSSFSQYPRMSTSYYVRGRWKGQSSGWGEWCTPVHFYTASVDGGDIDYV